MGYKNTKIIRQFQKQLFSLHEKVLFSFSHTTTGGKIILFGCFLCFISLFLPWVHIFGDSSSTLGIYARNINSFTKISGATGYFILTSISFAIFSLTSIYRKRRFYFFLQIQISEYASCLFASIMTLSFTLLSLNFIRSLQVFTGNMSYGKGIILCITGCIFMLVGTYFLKKETPKQRNISSENQSEQGGAYGDTGEDKKNMSLPF